MPETSDSTDRDGSADETDEGELPPAVVEECERLTRLALEAVDEDETDAYRERRAAVLEDHAFTARVRDDDAGDVLVLHPAEWHDGEVIRTDRIEDLSRAFEVPLEGPGDPDSWADLDASNRALAAAVRERHGEVHGENAETFADFMGNHCAKPMASATRGEIAEFLEEYFVRNAWPSPSQRAAIEESIELVFETAGESASDADVS
ncbi:DUF7108 family protein [Natronobiforma cellulositropha]|uniref:DUF7108 family protein n=1 Tax=Natronobiforma cellulositropha TaxID=1679076 RepID=UPI0021D5F81F|nr:rnhA operon protein [Natronobiforma cellulositropha]